MLLSQRYCTFPYFGELLQAVINDKAKTALNPNAASAAEADVGNVITIELDAKFLEHIATDTNCKGLVVFTRSNGARSTFSSKDKPGLEPKLVLFVK